jgi:hypothetical protein
MRNLLILAVAASFAVACAGRTEDEVGAAPERDTTAVIDDTTAVITADTAQVDTTMGQTPTDTGFVQPDTAGVGVDTSYTPSETGTPTDTLSQEPDTSAGAWSDTTAADTTQQQ